MGIVHRRLRRPTVALAALVSLTACASAPPVGADPNAASVTLLTVADPFVRVSLTGTPLFGVHYAGAERLSPGVYRVAFARDMRSCAPLLSIRDQASDVDGYADVWTADPTAVWVATWRDFADGTREPLSVTFDLALRCAGTTGSGR